MAEAYLNKKVITVAGGVSINGASTITGTYQETISANKPIYSIEEPAVADTSNWDDFTNEVTKLGDTTLVPSTYPLNIDWSSDDTYMAFPSDASPFLHIYKRTDDTFAQITPGSLPPDNGKEAIFSPDDTYLAVVHDLTPFISIYKRSGDTFTKLANPASLPTGDGQSVSWSSDGIYMAVVTTTSPYYCVYKRSGDTFTKLTTPTLSPTGAGNTCSFSPDDTYLVIGSNSTERVTIYKRSGDTFTKLTAPSTLPTNSVVDVTWTPDGIHLITSHNTTPWITIYKRSGDTFTKLANPSTLPNDWTQQTDVSPDGKYLFVGYSLSSPRMLIYSISGDTFTKLPDWDPLVIPPTYTNATVYGSFSSNNQYLALGGSRTDGTWAPYMSIYKTTLTAGAAAYNKIYSSANDIADVTASINALGYANTAGVLNDVKTDITAIWKVV